MSADPEARLHVMEVRARYFRDENVRLRSRVHEAVDECQRRYAKDMKELERRRWLSIWAQDELDKYWTGRYSHVSSLGRSIVENLVGRVRSAESAESAVQRVRELHQDDGDGWCRECGYFFPCETIQALIDPAAS